MPLVPLLSVPLIRFTPWLIRIAEPIYWGLVLELMDEDAQAEDVDALEWRYAVVRWSKPSITGAVEDYAQVGFHLVNITDGDVDTSWTSGDYTACTTAISEWWTSIRSAIYSGYTLVDVRYYRKRFSSTAPWGELAAGVVDRFAESGPPAAIATVGSAGTSASTALPQQVAMSVTLKTGAPTHWGRVYIPGLSAGNIGTTGRISSGTITTVANATAELLDDFGTAGFYPVVPSTQHDRILTPGLLGVTGVQVDDIPDVIRRRRARTTLIRTAGTPTA